MKALSANGLNYQRVLRSIWLNEGISRREIADLLGLDKSTITNITASLQKDMIIVEQEEGEAGPQGGRKPIKLKINRTFCAAAGIDVQPESCNVVCTNPFGELLFSKRIDADISAGHFSKVFAEIVAELESKLGDMGIALAGIGLGLSGIVDPGKGVILESIPLGVTAEYELMDELSAYTDIPVMIDNDGNCCCWGELVFNRTEKLQDFICCLIEFREHRTAIGMGIVIDGKVHYGRNYSAGEFRSIFAGEDTNGQTLSAAGGNTAIHHDSALFQEFAEELGRNLALLVNTFSLSDCFIGGDLNAEQTAVLSRVLKQEFDRNWSYAGDSACRIRTSSIGDNAVAYGAASMIIDRLFRIPDFREQGSEDLIYPIKDKR